MFCPLSLLLARAIQDQAFDPSYCFHTLEDVLTRPKLPAGSDQIPLKWKGGMESVGVFKMCYDTYRIHFQACVLASGLRNRHRPYGVRVGTGNTLDDGTSSSQPAYTPTTARKARC